MMDGGERLVKGSISTVIEPGPDIIHHGDKLSTARKREEVKEGEKEGRGKTRRKKRREGRTWQVIEHRKPNKVKLLCSL